MTVETDADRLAFLTDFGEDVTVGGSSFTAILDREYVEAGGVSGYAPVLTCRQADHESVSLAAGDAATIDGADYIVREIHDDGTGMSQIIMEAA